MAASIIWRFSEILETQVRVVQREIDYDLNSRDGDEDEYMGLTWGVTNQIETEMNYGRSSRKLGL